MKNPANSNPKRLGTISVHYAQQLVDLFSYKEAFKEETVGDTPTSHPEHSQRHF